MIDIITRFGGMLAQSMGYTLLMTLFSLLIAFVIGLIFGLMNVSKSKVLNAIGTIYIDVIRGVPLMVLAFFIYFSLPALMQTLGFAGFRLTIMQAGTAALSMNCGAYMAEIIRAGIQSVDRGQMEAARSLGLTYAQGMTRIVLPQAIRTMIPSIINQFIITLKDTSILSAIGYPELFNTGKSVAALTLDSLNTWTVVGLMYLIVITVLSRIAKMVERRVNRGK